MIVTASRLVAFLLFAATSIAMAQVPRSVALEAMTWTELRDQIRGGKTTVLLPIGGTEQNGPHMALGKHNARAAILADRIAIVLGNALVAPVLAYVAEGNVSPPSAHMRFPGTITMPEATFESVVEYAARSFRLSGFRDIVLLADHGGYRKSLHAVAAKLNREWAANATRVHAIDAYYQAAESGFAATLKARGFTDAEIGSHAGLADTSLTLALAPGLVRTEPLGSGSKPGTADGVTGDPRRASAELGQVGVDLIVAQTVDAIRAAVAKR